MAGLRRLSAGGCERGISRRRVVCERGFSHQREVECEKGISRRRGLGTVEMALVLPVLLLLLMGVLEYSWMFLRAHEITNLARHGARVAARADAGSDRVREELEAMLAAAGIGGATVEIDPDAESETGTVITVTVSATYRGNLELIGLPLLPVPETLRASVAMAKEGT